MENVSDKSCIENRNTCFMFNDLFFFNHAVYEIMKNIAERGRPQMTVQSLRFACWVTKSRTQTYTHNN